MQILITMALIIIGILMFELIIFFHEFGHFITAKLSGVKVNEFALGMGPKLFGFKKGETQYSLRLFPIGGYCAMEGEDADSPEPRAFNNAKIWKRMIIIIAGATMNILLGFIMMFAYTVQMDVYSSTTVSGFEPNSFSLNCGLKPGDKILDVNGYSILNARDLQFAIATLTPKQLDGHSLEIYRQDCSREACMVYQNLAQKYSPDQDTNQEMLSALTSASYKIAEAESKEAAYSLMKQAIDDLYSKIADAKDEKYEYPKITESDERWRFCADMTVERGDEKQKLEQVQFYTYYKSQEDKENNKMSVAFDFYVEPVEKTFGSVMHETFSGTISMGRTVWTSLVWLVQGRFSFNELSGPVGIATAVTQVASQGLETGFMDAVNNILFVMILITVNLGIVNMLPFPALDGGRFLFLLIEWIFRKPIPRKVEKIVNTVGIILLFAFMAIISLKDVWQLITGTMPGM